MTNNANTDWDGFKVQYDETMCFDWRKKRGVRDYIRHIETQTNKLNADEMLWPVTLYIAYTWMSKVKLTFDHWIR